MPAKPSRLRHMVAAALPPIYVTAVTAVWLALVAALLVPAAAAAARGQPSAIVALALAICGFLLGATAPTRWLALRAAERNGSVYTRLGVRRFRSIAFRGDIMNRTLRRLTGVPVKTLALPDTRRSLARWTLWNEHIHWAWVLAIPALVVWGALHERPLAATILCVATVPLNVYPILLQRYTRGRIAPLEHARRGTRQSPQPP